jgi:hypothetical protein
VLNFSQEDIVLPITTVLGVAEEISPRVVAAINDSDGNRTPSLVSGKERRLTDANMGAKYNEYLEDVLGHLTRK